MNLDWSTFLLEIINFLVLIWILKRFLYKPVLNAITQRRAAVEKTLSESERLRQEAQTLRDQYEHRLADWEQEKEKVRSQMLADVNAERTRLLAGLRSSLEQEREKARVLEARHLGELTRQAEEAAVAQSVEFASRLLSRVAGPELGSRLVALILDDLRTLPEEQRQALRAQEQWESLCAACAKPEVPVTVTSAYPLTPTQRDALSEALRSLIGRPVACEWLQDTQLLAGVRLSLGHWVMGANLQDELKFFVKATHHAGPITAS